MFVERMLNEAVKRLVSVGGDAPIVDAARPLNYRDIDLVVVCGADGRLAGVITKTDVVRQFCSGSACASAAQAMTRDVVFCYPSDLLRDVWALMKERNVRNVLSSAKTGGPWECSAREMLSRSSWARSNMKKACYETT